MIGFFCRRSFYVRLREKPISKNDMAQYEHMHVVGHFRSDKNIFVGVMRPVRDRPITELSLIEAIQDQYITRHLPDGRIIYSDHRISTIAGYLPSEVTGHSAFNFFYAEDLPWTTMAMRHSEWLWRNKEYYYNIDIFNVTVFASSSGEGSTVYRLFTNSGELICLQTKGFLEYNKAKNKVKCSFCTFNISSTNSQPLDRVVSVHQHCHQVWRARKVSPGAEGKVYSIHNRNRPGWGTSYKHEWLFFNQCF